MNIFYTAASGARILSTPSKGLLLLSLMIFESQNSCLALTLDEIALAGAMQAQRIASIEYQTTGNNRYTIRYFHEGSKFRVEYLNRDQTPTRILTYNNSNSFSWEGKANLFGKSAERLPGRILPLTSNPLYVPYYWLFVLEDSYSWDVVCSVSNWQKIFAKGHIQEIPEKVQGVRCHVVTLEFPKARTKLFFSEDPAGFPMSWKCIERATENVLSEGQVSKYEIMNGESGQFIFPLAATYLQSATPLTIAREVESSIIPASLKINHDIDDDLFTLTPTHTDRVIDIDKHRAELNKLSSNIVAEAKSGRRWFLWINIAVVMTLIGLLCRRWLTARPSATFRN